MSSHHHSTGTTHTSRGLFGRKRRQNVKTTESVNPITGTHKTTTTTTTHGHHSTAHGHHTTTAGAPVTHHHRRRPSIGDKISGAMLKLRGSLTRRPGLKAAGTRRMNGTDGRGSHHAGY